MGNRGFADPAEGKAGEGNSKLHSRQEIVEALLQALNSSGTRAPGVDQLLDAGIAQAYDGELGSHKEGVQSHQQHDHQDA